MTNEIKLAFSHPVERSRSNFSATELDRISLRDHSGGGNWAFQSERELLRGFVLTSLLR